MAGHFTTGDTRAPVPWLRFVALPIIALVFALPEPACVSRVAREEQIEGRRSALILGRAVKVFSGEQHACALTNTGAVVCWGLGLDGQLGNGGLASSPAPVAVSGLDDAVSVSVGGAHTCAVRRGGTVVCWGDGTSGQLGTGTSTSSPTPVAVSGITTAVSVAAGGAHSCAVLSGGTIMCWGLGLEGQLGDGSSASSSTPVTVSAILDGVSVTAGLFHTCAVRGAGQVVCWGEGSDGQLGNGSSTSSPTRVAVSGIVSASSVAAGLNHTCAVENGHVRCWGDGLSGQLGGGGSASSALPVTASGLLDAESVAAGVDHTCARRATGQVVCWGNNTGGQLGDGTTISSPVPVTVSGLSDAVSIAAGLRHSCAVRGNAEAVCWGQADQGQLGNGTTGASPELVVVSGISDAASVTAGRYHTCVIHGPLGEGACWGWNQYGQLGSGTPHADSPVPVTVSPLSGAVSVEAGEHHTCAIRGAGAVRCWGDNIEGQLGDGTTDDSPTPVAVSGLTNAVSVASGGFHTCAVRAGGTVVCWGEGSDGQLGNGGLADSLVPVSVTGLSDAASVTAGFIHTCAVRSTGAGVVCWGHDDVGVASSVPVAVSGLTSPTFVAAGSSHTCAINAGGSVSCWGAGGDGQLGNGSLADSSVPVTVTGLSGATSLTAGESHTCAIYGTGQVACWGLGRNGQIGSGSSSRSPVPIDVSGLSNAVSIAAGRAHTCAVRATGQVVCWGFDLHGQLGNGMPWKSSVPVTVLGLGDIACTSDAACASGFCVDGVCCGGPCGGGVATDCQACSVAAGGAIDGACGPRGLGAVCRALGGDCDVAPEVCDGGSLACPADTLLASGTVCHPSVGLCDPAETCDGSSPICPSDQLAPAGQVCRPLAGGCDIAETCTGLAAACPTDSFAPVGTVCHPGTAPCESTETCTGLDGSCPGPAAPPPPSCTFRVAYTGTRTLLANANGTTTPGKRRDDTRTTSAPSTLQITETSPFNNSHNADAFSVVDMGATMTVSTRLNGVAALGRLSGTIESEASTDMLSSVDPVTTFGRGIETMNWSDEVTVTSPTLPAGTAVQFLAQLELESHLGNDGGEVVPALPTEPAFATATAAVGGTTVLTLTDRISLPLVTRSTTALVNTHVGDTLVLNGSLQVYAMARLKLQTLVRVTADAGHTAIVRLVPVTSGASYVTASGRGPYVPDATPPVVTIDSPVAGAVVNRVVPVVITARDNSSGVARIEAWAGTVRLGECRAASCTLSLDTRTFPDGPLLLRAFAWDFEGNASAESRRQLVVDNTPPVFSNVPQSPVIAYATSTAGAKVTYTKPTACDARDGTVDVTCVPAPGAQFPLKKTPVTCTAYDKRGNTSTATFTVWVQYQAPTDGSFFLPPIRSNGSSIFRIGRPVPVRFRLTGASAAITNLNAKLVVTKISNAIQGTIEDTSDETVADTDFVFKYVSGPRWYAYRWKTVGQTQGTYQLRADLGDEVLRQVNVSLKTQGGSR